MRVIPYFTALVDQWERQMLTSDDVVREVRRTLLEEAEIAEAELIEALQEEAEITKAEASFIEEAEFLVTATLRVTIPFSPIARPTPLVPADAIGNAVGTMPDGFWDALANEGWSIQWEAVKS